MIQIQSYVIQIQGCGATIGEMYFQQIQRYIPGLVPVMSSISSENLKTFIVSHYLNIFMCTCIVYTCVHMKLVISTSNMTPLQSIEVGDSYALEQCDHQQGDVSAGNDYHHYDYDYIRAELMIIIMITIIFTMELMIMMTIVASQ